MRKTIFYIIFIAFLSILLNLPASAKDQKFISIEPHMGYGNSQEFFIGGKVYNYKGPVWTRSPYYSRPNLLLNFGAESVKFTSDSEGYFWLKIPIKPDTNLNYGANNPNTVSITMDKEQTRKNKKLILVSNYGLNVNKIFIPFIVPSPDAQYGIVSDFDDTLTITQGTGFKEVITTDYRIFVLRDRIMEVYNTLSRKINPVFYVTGRPNGTYKVVEEFLTNHNFPIGPILARDLGFWFINRGLSLREHKTSAIINILTTYPNLKLVLIGDNKFNDPQIYYNIKKQYPERILAIFIFKVESKNIVAPEDIVYITNPQEILNEMARLGCVQ